MLKLYYKSVNRGLTFTKPGLYTMGYVLAIGLLAIVTGINGLYVFLATGLSFLIISGMISERIMRYSKVTHLEAVTADAHSAFNIGFTVANTSSSFTTYGIHTSFTAQKPKITLISKPIDAPILGHAVKIAPDSAATFYARCGGLPRGHYNKMFVSQRTDYPFGFLEKFKIIELHSSVTIAPKVDESLLQELLTNLSRRRAQAEADREFYSHYSYTQKQPIRFIDWKRSAGKPSKDWVIKQYRSETQNFHYKIVGSWQTALECRTEEQYELFLSRLRTAVKALQSERATIGLETGVIRTIWQPDNILSVLASAPPFLKRSEGLSEKGAPLSISGRSIFIEIGLTSWNWQDQPTSGKAV